MKNQMMFFKKTWFLVLALLLLGSLSACGAPADESSVPPEEDESAAGQQEEPSYTTHSTQGVAFQVPADWTQAEGTDLFYATGRPEVYGLNGVSPLGSYEPQEFYKALVEHYEETNQFSDLQTAESMSSWQSADGVDCYAADFTGYQDFILYCSKLIIAPQKNLVLTFCGQANAETLGDTAPVWDQLNELCESLTFEIGTQDTVRCKEYLYLAAYCQICLCGWPDDDELHVATCHVSSQQLHTFLMAVIADANDDFITDLGRMLMLPERNFKDSILISRGEATIFLATEDYEKAYRSAEHLQSVLKKAKRSSSMWMYYAQGIKAVIEKDETSLDAALCTFINECRKVDDLEAPELLNYYATGLAKLAVKNGLQVTIDTMDCPQALIQPVQMDYSHLELPRPKYGFPWEKEAKD